MKRFNYYLSLMLLLVFTAACNDEFDQPPMVIPVAEHTANMTIAEFKAKHWQDERNFIDTVFEDEIIHGWVTSSDEEGNIYKQLYISDGTAGITVSIDQGSLYTKYRIGQEVVIPMKGRYIGKFNGTYCLGIPYFYEAQSVWESNRMSMEMWNSMAEINGLPDISKVDTTVIELSDIATADAATQLKYMSRLVRINGVSFTAGGQAFSEAENSTDREIVDDNGNSLPVSNSNYASFRANILPKGIVDIVGQLSYTASKGFFLLLRSASDVIPVGTGGTKAEPFTVAEAIERQNTGAKGWVGGYIVGAVAPEVTNVSSNADIEWQAPTTLDNTLVIADDPECKDYTKCLIIPLPQGSSFREDVNLKNNPKAYKTYLKVKGVFATYMGAAGLTNEGSYDEFIIDLPVISIVEGFDSGIPSNWTNLAVSGGKYWDTYKYTSGGREIICAQFRPQKSSSAIETWLITPKLDIKNARDKIFSFTSEVHKDGNNNLELYLLDSKDPTTATVKVKLNPTWPPKPSSGYSAWVSSGVIDLSQWEDGEYYIGFCYDAPASDALTTWCIDDVQFNPSGKSLNEVVTESDFETILQGQERDYTTTLGTYTSDAGWVATNCSILKGGDGDNNPVFAFIGKSLDGTTWAKAPTMCGGTTTVGTIVSPTMKGGMKQLRFSYGCAYSGSVLSFRVDIKQNGSVVKTWTVSDYQVVQRQAYTFSENCSINGEFTIEFTNLCPSNATGNTRDRVSIWNVNWDSAN